MKKKSKNAFEGCLFLLVVSFLIVKSCSDSFKDNYLEMELEKNSKLEVVEVFWGDDALEYCGYKLFSFDEDKDENYYSDSIPNRIDEAVAQVNNNFDKLLGEARKLPVKTVEDRLENLSTYESLLCLQPSNEVVKLKVGKYKSLVNKDEENEIDGDAFILVCKSTLKANGVSGDYELRGGMILGEHSIVGKVESGKVIADKFIKTKYNFSCNMDNITKKFSNISSIHSDDFEGITYEEYSPVITFDEAKKRVIETRVLSSGG